MFTCEHYRGSELATYTLLGGSMCTCPPCYDHDGQEGGTCLCQYCTTDEHDHIIRDGMYSD